MFENITQNHWKYVNGIWHCNAKDFLAATPSTKAHLPCPECGGNINRKLSFQKFLDKLGAQTTSSSRRELYIHPPCQKQLIIVVDIHE